MSRILLDTHAFIWFVEGSEQLSTTARRLIEDTSLEKLISVASAWEMHIKAAQGRLPLEESLQVLIPEQIASNGFSLLPIKLSHLAPIATLPLHHRDPFDRLLIAQALVEGVPLISRDIAFDAYEGLTRLW